MALLEAAKKQIAQRIGKIEQESAVYETEPWGFEDENLFLNQLLQIQTTVEAERLLEIALSIEASLGRERSEQSYSGRTMDIDILFYDSLVLSSKKLSIPHPRVHLRRFALEPLNEIARDLQHPTLLKSMHELLNECQDKQKVHIFTAD
ncbi:MAG: 2-amino-4-hydroxy-6-hydroxymethyldihydropteridine diphosphokinase [Flavobacteriales bacterium]|nr:2-amino-4-hydroxy-6-hydroxymethyldihydropteridine diphosphokinase [Flavobacteriales bacterium]